MTNVRYKNRGNWIWGKELCTTFLIFCKFKIIRNQGLFKKQNKLLSTRDSETVHSKSCKPLQ